MAEISKRQGGPAQGRQDDADAEETGSSRKRERETGNGNGEHQSIGSMVAHHAKSLVDEQVAKRAGKPAADLGKLAKALLLTSEQLEGNLASPYVSRAATQLEKFASFLENAKGEDALRSVEEFARKQPLWFLGGAAVLGFGGARFLKSTASRSNEQRSEPARTRSGQRSKQGSASAGRRA
jgi:hypothetical protein